MLHQTTQNLVDELDALLDRERHALVEGDLQFLGKMLAQKENLIERISAVDTFEQRQLTHVHKKATRNQELLNSALEGIRAVAIRMADLRRVRQGLEIYDKSGRKSRYATRNDTGVEKRA
jgi:tRNA A37 N6-isopentenylltransferase MiaA